MKDAGILDGDLVLVKPQRDAESGEMVVAMIEGEATVKQLIKEKKRVILQPKNDAFAPIVITKKDPPLQILRQQPLHPQPFFQPDHAVLHFQRKHARQKQCHH